MDGLAASTPSAPVGAENSDWVKDTDTPNFPKDVLEASKEQPVLVDFWAPWCGPCKQLGPAIEKSVTAKNGAVKLVKINVDENQALAGQMGVQSIPAVFAFANGQPVDGFMGALPESEINKFIDGVIEKAGAGAPSDPNDPEAQITRALDVAQQALDAGDKEQAAQIFQLVLQQVPDHLAATLGLASILIESGQLQNAREILDQINAERQSDEQYVKVSKALHLAEQAEKLGDSAELRSKIEADPNDHQAHIDLAVQLNAAGAREEAAEILVASFKKDKDWNDAAARKTLLEFFEIWGQTDPATLRGRRLLSSVLFS